MIHTKRMLNGIYTFCVICLLSCNVNKTHLANLEQYKKLTEDIYNDQYYEINHHKIKIQKDEIDFQIIFFLSDYEMFNDYEICEEYTNMLQESECTNILPYIISNTHVNDYTKIKQKTTIPVYQQPLFNSIKIREPFILCINSSNEVIYIGKLYSTKGNSIIKSIILNDGCYINYDVRIQSSQYTINLGDVKRGSTHNCYFVITNIGDNTIEFEDISTSCDCTVASIERQSLKKNEYCRLNIKFTADLDDIGFFKRSIYLYLKDNSMPIVYNICGMIY